ncbi:MAG: hypothetical protein MO847_08780 [Candidatus Protistobacter heckmanni]|nr:hypothetical protein [Candidatus Protistobacter heckmanni]
MSKHAVATAKQVLSEAAQQAAHHSAEAEKHRICGNSEKAAYHAYLAQY